MQSEKSTPQPTYLADYQPPSHLIETVDLTFSIAPEKTTVTSKLQVRKNPKASSSDALVLNGEAIELLDVQLNGKALSKDAYQCDEKCLTLPITEDSFELTIKTSCDPKANKMLSGLYCSNDLYCTQCEAEGFRRITYYLDRPDVLATFTTTIIADEKAYPVLLSNGNPVASERLADGLHSVTWEDPFPKPAYLFALVAGDLACIEDSYTTGSGRQVKIAFYVEAQNKDKCEHAITSLKNSMAWDEKAYGREYDLEIYMVVAVSDFNMGAMENKGLNIFNTKYVLADPQTATDMDYQGIESVIGHEYFHNWSGNRVTCRDWFQLSLKEGFTVYREQQFAGAMGSPAVKRIQDVNLLRTRQFPEDAGPLAHSVQPASYIEINNFYTMTIYHKGAEVIRMQNILLGDEGFRKGTDLYFERFDGQAVTTDDFVATMAEANATDMTAFKRWYTQSGTPEVTVSSDYDEQKKIYTLTFEQHCPKTPDFEGTKKPFVIPIETQLLDENGKALPFALEAGDEPKATQVLVLEQAKQSIKISLNSKPIPALLGGFSAPIKLHFPYTQHEYGHLMKHASDPFNRWDAAQSLVSHTIRQLLKQKQSGKALLFDGEVFGDFGAVLEEKDIDKALLAQMLTLPSPAYLLDQLQSVDISALYEVIKHFETRFATTLKTYWKTLYEAYHVTGEYEISGTSIAKRSLKNTCLDLWVKSEDPAAITQAVKQFEQSTNMTDTMGALVALNDTPGDARSNALDAFYKQWKKEPLVVDKWLALQARSTLKNTLKSVQDLMQHEAFSLTNPNKVYALLSTFANTNLLHFHAADGSGYAFVAEKMVEIDAFNPLVSARLATAFSSWRRLDASRQAKVKKTLEDIVSASKLSSDLYELLTKTLAA